MKPPKVAKSDVSALARTFGDVVATVNNDVASASAVDPLNKAAGAAVLMAFGRVSGVVQRLFYGRARA